MRTFWNSYREFESQIDLVANKWFANFESKAKGKCVPCGPWIIFELNTKCASFWNLKTEIDLVANKWFANFEPKAKAKWVPCGSWINFQLSPKMQRKSARAGTWIANFWLNLFVLRAESFSSFDTKFNMKCFLCKIRTIIVCKTLHCFVQIDWPNFFGLFASSHQAIKLF